MPPLNRPMSRCMRIEKYQNFICLTIVMSIPSEQIYEISNDVVCVASKASDQPAHMRSLISAFASCINIL